MIRFFHRGNVAWARVPRPRTALGRPAATQRSLGTGDDVAARHVCQFLEGLKISPSEANDWLLSRMADGFVPVYDAYRAHVEGRLREFTAELRRPQDDPDLEPYVARWVREMERRKRPTPEIRRKYERQVRTLVVPGFRRSQLTKPRIRQWLQDLAVGQPNRYRAALSGFCGFLVLEEVLDFNPVRAVPASAEAPPRDRHLTPAEAERLVMAMPTARERALQAFLVVTCADVESARAVKVADFDWATPACYVRGTKKVWRERWCYVTPTWERLWQVVADYVKGGGFLPQAEPFAGPTYDQDYRSFQRVATALEVGDYSMKDHRHTWVVQAIRDGIDLWAIARQAGHKDPTMILKVYGRHISRADAYRKPAKVSALTLAEPQQKVQQSP